MLPIITTGGAQAMATAPDVCKTPTPPTVTPIPYPNLATTAQATGACIKVKILGCPIVCTNTQIPMSSGDEAGVAGGVVSGMIKGKVAFTLGASKVKAGGNPVVLLTGLTTQNKENAVGMVSSPSQTKVLATP